MNSFISPLLPLHHKHAYWRTPNPSPSLCSTVHTDPHPHPLLTDRTVQSHFLQTIWGKTPKLFRNLIQFNSLLTPDDLAGLSTESSYARIIRGSGNGPYTLTMGPFTDQTFHTLGNSDWTLLIDHVNHYLPELSYLLDRFNFLPNWRLDDIMVSYAPPGGSVGPHVDNYHVFLLQGSGTRLWKTSYTPISHADERIVAGLDVRILDGGFEPDEQWVLQPGDALYVPPRFPHHGISLDDQCMTYSIGFRAPTVASLISSWVNRIAETRSLHEQFYEDDVTDLLASIGDNGRVSHGAAEKAFTLVMNQLRAASENEFKKWFAQEVSQQTTFLEVEPSSTHDDIEVLLSYILRAESEGEAPILVRQREGSTFTYLEDDGDVSMFIDGERWPVADTDIAATICGKRCRYARDYAVLARRHASVQELIRKLLEADVLYIAESAKKERNHVEHSYKHSRG